MSAITMRRVDELQADRALWGLDPAEQAELDRLLQQTGEDLDASWELAAGAATVSAAFPATDSPPDRLLDEIRRSAPFDTTAEREATESPAQAHPRAPWGTRLLAAAAIVCATFLWTDDSQDSSPPSARMGRSVLATAEGASIVAWHRGASPLSGRASGDLVWHGATQRGYMRFRDLPANDANRRQYQLWIFDASRSDAYPVDGGVFDIPAGVEEVIIPIDPKLVVFQAAAFVVTVEGPGGTVVSDRKNVVALAKF